MCAFFQEQTRHARVVCTSTSARLSRICNEKELNYTHDVLRIVNLNGTTFVLQLRVSRVVNSLCESLAGSLTRYAQSHRMRHTSNTTRTLICAAQLRSDITGYSSRSQIKCTRAAMQSHQRITSRIPVQTMN
jgi:hypothetical protein